MYNNFADLYAIIKTTNKLEKAYVRDLVSSVEYKVVCLKFIAQFCTLHFALYGTIPSLDHFIETYHLDAPTSINHLLLSSVLTTIEHRVIGSSSAIASASTTTSPLVINGSFVYF
ncbi:vacuolar protein sorting-associated protein 28 homolog 1-like [Musa acuminata AAA Group]|uniref:vacuolar protein sorting-associated protein 28 homolog 1-like n=1 Tax=Musa acuminata AAA Group TaxID=214697 RepID=UPI0031E449E5